MVLSPNPNIEMCSGDFDVNSLVTGMGSAGMGSYRDGRDGVTGMGSQGWGHTGMGSGL